MILCKDRDGKVGLRVKSIDKGVFVALVTKGSPAAMGGLRFGDQILQINGENVAGYDEAKVHKIFKKAGDMGVFFYQSIMSELEFLRLCISSNN